MHRGAMSNGGAVSDHQATDRMALLVDPETRETLVFDGASYRTADGRQYGIEHGIVRMLGAVDPDLARELEAQDAGVEEYLSPLYLMQRYERKMAELAVVELFGGTPPSGLFLDAGCGVGLLGRMFPNLGLVGLDASFTLLRHATVGYRLRVEASAERMPFPDACFDGVMALNMLHHVIRPENAVREFARVLKPGGTLVTVDPRKVSIIETAKRVLRGNHEGFAPTHKAFGVEEYERLLLEHGPFELERSERVGLVTLVVMGGLDALRLSPHLPGRDALAAGLVALDRLLFRVPNVDRAGLNLVVRARRAG